ncbi:MAG: hypothetical protein K8F52_12220 [Candidatus Scalindua rubra]|uniref:Uncharacterized protein n=1 Tax=Candidatus Scalindua brodae TaxID=237368 RepID=A0A0B0EJR8_9BACT|nr:MAG: hypothetical protein SCABRO_01965 [Candidatus Scalindua brodae]MBZ0109423.1 hypothetical protein [Candidatus Scalindua rubra]
MLPQDTEAEARHYANQIRQERLARAQDGVDRKKASAKEETQYEHVDINSLITNDAKTIDAEHVAICQMNEYGFDKKLADHNFTEKQIDYATLKQKRVLFFYVVSRNLNKS